MRQENTNITEEEAALFQERMKRLCMAIGLGERATQVVLAEKMGVRQSSISDAKRRASIPDSWLMRAYMEFNTRPEYVLNGEEPMHVTDGATVRPQKTVLLSYKRQLEVLRGAVRDVNIAIGNALEAIEKAEHESEEQKQEEA